MARLEELTKGTRVRGISPAGVVTVIDAEWIGSDVVNLTYEDSAGNLERELVYRTSEPALELDGEGRPWSLDADPELFMLVSEAKRIQLAYLFDPYLAAQTSDVDPLPHQIEAVYQEMLTRQPLRFLLADDPGAGKTIMAGLLIKELIARGDLDRCLVVAPGGLVEQWQDELGEKFGLEFDLLTRDLVEGSRTGNPFAQRPLLISRLDMLARNDDLLEKLAQTEWDLVVVDEAHKMSASYFSDEVKETKRYRLGKRARRVGRRAGDDQRHRRFRHAPQARPAGVRGLRARRPACTGRVRERRRQQGRAGVHPRRRARARLARSNRAVRSRSAGASEQPDRAVVQSGRRRVPRPDQRVPRAVRSRCGSASPVAAAGRALPSEHTGDPRACSRGRRAHMGGVPRRARRRAPAGNSFHVDRRWQLVETQRRVFDGGLVAAQPIGLGLRVAPWSPNGLATPRVVPMPDGTLYYAAVEDEVVVDRSRSAAEQGLRPGSSLGVPVIRRLSADGTRDEVVARGALTFAVRGDGTIAYARGATPELRFDAPYATDIVVRSPHGAEEVLTSRRARWEVRAWAGDRLVVHEGAGELEGGTFVLLDETGATSPLPPGVPVALNDDGTRLVVASGPPLDDAAADATVVTVVDTRSGTVVASLPASTLQAAGVSLLHDTWGDWAGDTIVLAATPQPVALRVGNESLSVVGTVPVKGSGWTSQLAIVGSDGGHPEVVMLREDNDYDDPAGAHEASVVSCSRQRCRTVVTRGGARQDLSLAINYSRGNSR